MRLRTRFETEIKARFSATLPMALETVWDSTGVVVVIESLQFQSDGFVKNQWEHLVHVTGFLRVELRVEGIDTLDVEPLITNLVGDPIVLVPALDPVAGDISENVRATLVEWKDTVRETRLVSALRFEIEGKLLRYDPDPARAELIVNGQPVVGEAA